MGYLRRGIMLFAACLLPVAAWAQAAEKWQVPSGAIAFFTLGPGRYVLATEQPFTPNAPFSGVNLITIEDTALPVYVIESEQPLSIGKNKAGWQIARISAASGAVSQAPMVSAIFLNNRWRLGGQAIRRTTVDIEGARWQIGLTPKWQRNGRAMVGVALPYGAQLPAAAEVQPILKDTKKLAYASIEPAAGLTPVPMPNVSETDLFGSIRTMLTPPQVVPLRGLPVVLYQPGRVQPLPKSIQITHLIPAVVTPTAAPSPTTTRGPAAASTSPTAPLP
jgi:hypothetical protein